MKKIIILLPILILVSYFSFSQNNCGTEPSAEYLQELDNSLSTLPGCQDPSNFDLSAPITFNLVLYYAKFGTGIGEFNQVQFDDVIGQGVDNQRSVRRCMYDIVNRNYTYWLPHRNQTPFRDILVRFVGIGAA